MSKKRKKKAKHCTCGSDHCPKCLGNRVNAMATTLGAPVLDMSGLMRRLGTRNPAEAMHFAFHACIVHNLDAVWAGRETGGCQDRILLPEYGTRWYGTGQPALVRPAVGSEAGNNDNNSLRDDSEAICE